MLILPADHLIENIQSFHEAVDLAVKIADADQLATFGIVPKSPETGYGYIKRGQHYQQNSQQGSYKIAQFVEKPDAETAESYTTDDSYLWNSGMFVLKASVFLKELKQHNKPIFEQCRLAYETSAADLDFTRVDKTLFSACPSDSIDYAVMEKTDKGIIIPIDVGWNDIGSWSALWDVGTRDENGNVIHGDVLLHATRNSFIHSENRLVATIGIADCVIVETADAVMVARKDCVQDVKKIVALLRARGREEANTHRCVYRPWGSYESISVGDRFQAKLITVKP